MILLEVRGATNDRGNMAKYTFDQVKRNVAEIANRDSYTKDFIFELMAAYGRSASSITQLKTGAINKSTDKDALLQKGVVFLKLFPAGTQLEEKVEEMDMDPLSGRYKPRYIIATDLKHLAAKDTIKRATLDIKIRDIDREIKFFYGWTGNEHLESPRDEPLADRKAANLMQSLYDYLEKDNLKEFSEMSSEFRHGLNVFFARLLFCLFAEDTGLFKKDLFSNSIKDYTDSCGVDVKGFLEQIFRSLDTKDKNDLVKPFSEFPYVNGSIFSIREHHYFIPEFGPESRRVLLECAASDWSNIDPDIFGTMFQGIVDEKRRNENGMDYTSVSNIEKVINPLFMDELYAQFDKTFKNDDRVKDVVTARIKHLDSLWDRISKIKIFDPACGSGNFLIISYKRLRELEMKILREKRSLKSFTGRDFHKSRIELKNFFGIELEDFPRELAVLSMFIAEHQMNMEFNDEFGKEIVMLPIQDQPNIVCGNAVRFDWQEVCPNKPHNINRQLEQSFFTLGESILNGNDVLAPSRNNIQYDEIYVIGNPPYKGADEQSVAQKQDFRNYFNGEDYSGNMDYISLWFIKGARYISGTKAKLAFVSTNSICQGEHVALMFPKIFEENIEIDFAYKSFKWSNNAKDQAGVTVVILGLQNAQNNSKRLYSNNIIENVGHISPYLIPGDDLIILKSKKTLMNNFPEMVFGSMPRSKDLVLSKVERDELVTKYPESQKFVKQYLGAEEYINGKDRYALWITDSDVVEARKIPEINHRLELVEESRSKSRAESTRRYARFPHRFVQISYKPTPAIIAPRVSSERRVYIPMGFLDKDIVISDAANAIYDAEPWLFAVLQSKIHMAWIRTVCGKLKTDYRYSSTLGYNTFPCPPLTEAQKEKLNQSARNILFARANHPELTLADMYDPDKMPNDLRKAHEDNDILVDKLYQPTPFQNDEARLAVLFKLYEEMTAQEK